MLFTSLRVMGLFLRSKAPDLVFSVTYPRGSFTLSAFSSTSSELRLPPQIRHETDGGLRLGGARSGSPVTSEKPHNPRACWHAR
jgi:hypothetical protein